MTDDSPIWLHLPEDKHPLWYQIKIGEAKTKGYWEGRAVGRNMAIAEMKNELSWLETRYERDPS